MIDKFECFIELLRREYALDAHILSSDDMYFALAGCKRFYVQTPFKGFSIQFVTNLKHNVTILYCLDRISLGYGFKWTKVQVKIVNDDKFNEYFGLCNLAKDKLKIMRYINRLIKNIYISFDINNFRKLLQYYAGKMGYIEFEKQEEFIYELICGKDKDSENINQDIYKCGYRSLKNVLITKISLIFVEIKSFIIEPLQNIVLYFLFVNDI